jgi:PAS domain S-box-containing protein
MDFAPARAPRIKYKIYFIRRIERLIIPQGEISIEQPDTISILFVDDEPLFLDSFNQLLERQPGFSVTAVNTVAEAMELINTRYFDVIISDFAMPDMDGITLLQDIRARGCQSVFVIVTAKRLAHIAIDAMNAGADYYFQKGSDPGTEIVKLAAVIRKKVPERRAGQERGEWESFYQSVVENHTDLLCRIDPEGTIRYVNETGVRFFGKSYDELLESDFFLWIPDQERSFVLARLQNLSAINPDLHIEHHIGGGKGDPAIHHWSYRGFFTPQGGVTEYQVSGKNIASIVRIVKPGLSPATAPSAPAAPRPAAPASQAAPAAVPQPEPEVADWKGLVDTIQSLDNPVFAVDKNGVIIAWNRGLEELTGVLSSAMIGKGLGEYSIPFHGKPTPMLIDHIIQPSADSGIGIKKVGDTYIGDVKHAVIKGKPMLLWGKGSAVYDAKGRLIAAIEAITVGEPQQDGTGEEYLGGISSITLKVSGEGVGGAIAGAIGSSTGGYGIYATDKRVFVIRNPDLNAESPQGVQFGTFMMDELFGTTVDTRPKTIKELENLEIFSATITDIAKIELKRPVLLSGYLTITAKDGKAFRIYIDHKKAYTHIEQLMKSFAPEILKIE